MTSFIEQEQTSELKKRLKRTWTTFFGRYGKFLPIQLEAIPIVLKCKNAIIVSSTASGKTETVVAPLTEKILEKGMKSMTVLYISPTRALVNDMYNRLRDQLEELGISISLKTGDKPQFNPDKTPNFLITTPESFDSLICRYPRSFKNLKAVILDDIHLIDNTYRGDQLRLLLRRLEGIADTYFNTYILSATIAEPEDMARRYCEDFEVIKVSGKKEVEYSLVGSLKEVFNFFRKEKLKKLLIFCNTRSSVEMISMECKELWGKDRVVSHHGSLSKDVREEAESFMKEAPYGVCVATMTLEIGIDIGDIDGVVLAEVPWSVASLLQRIGRANRRSPKNRVFAVYTSEDERVLFEQMFKNAIDGHIDRVDYSPDLSVVVQQIFSSLYAHRGGLKDEYFMKLFDSFCSKDDLRDILKNLLSHKWVEKRNDKWYATTKLMDFGEKGKIHSNIPTSKTLKVFDINSKKIVGEVEDLVEHNIDEIFILGGRAWKIINISGGKIDVMSAKKMISTVKFKSHLSKGAYYFFLPQSIIMRDKSEI